MFELNWHAATHFTECYSQLVGFECCVPGFPSAWLSHWDYWCLITFHYLLHVLRFNDEAARCVHFEVWLVDLRRNSPEVWTIHPDSFGSSFGRSTSELFSAICSTSERMKYDWICWLVPIHVYSSSFIQCSFRKTTGNGFRCINLSATVFVGETASPPTGQKFNMFLCHD